MTSIDERFSRIRTALANAAGQRPVQLLAVSKTQPAAAVRALAALGQRAFGENYVQEALAKQRELADLDLEWHLIGPLQSNKCREAATHFDWVQTVDREKLIPLLAKFRPAERAAAQRAGAGQHRRRSQQVRLRRGGNRRAGRRDRAPNRDCACAD